MLDWRGGGGRRNPKPFPGSKNGNSSGSVGQKIKVYRYEVNHQNKLTFLPTCTQHAKKVKRKFGGILPITYFVLVILIRYRYIYTFSQLCFGYPDNVPVYVHFFTTLFWLS